MKTNTIFGTGYSVLNLLMAMLILSVLTITSCSKDKDAVTPVAAFEGSYEAEKSASKKYTMIIEKKDGNSFQIKNFADFLNVPLNAVGTGNQLTIPQQTFTNPNGKQLILSGTATLTNDELFIKYNVGGFTEYESDIVAKRKK